MGWSPDYTFSLFLNSYKCLLFPKQNFHTQLLITETSTGMWGYISMLLQKLLVKQLLEPNQVNKSIKFYIIRYQGISICHMFHVTSFSKFFLSVTNSFSIKQNVMRIQHCKYVDSIKQNLLRKFKQNLYALKSLTCWTDLVYEVKLSFNSTSLRMNSRLVSIKRQQLIVKLQQLQMQLYVSKKYKISLHFIASLTVA